MIREAQEHPVTITKQDQTVAVVMSVEHLEAIAETMEILADPATMQTIRTHREVHGVYHDVSVLDEL